MIIPENSTFTLQPNATSIANPIEDAISWTVLLISLAVFVSVCVILTLLIVLILFISKAHQNHRRSIISSRPSTDESRGKSDAKIRLLQSTSKQSTAQSGTEDDATTCSSASDTNTDAHLANSSSSGQPTAKHPKVPACLTQGQPPPVIQNQLMSDLKKLQREKKLTSSSGNER